MVADADLGMGGRVLEKINKNLIDGNLGFPLLICMLLYISDVMTPCRLINHSLAR